jgi:hypothetical protein
MSTHIDLQRNHLHSDTPGFNIRRFVWVPFGPSVPFRIRTFYQGRRRELKDREIGLIQGFLLCLRDSRAVRLQTSRWKRSLLVFSSGVCLEIAALPFLVGLIGYETTWYGWLLTWLFLPLGLLGLYASKFGDDRLVESLLVIPKLDLRL